MDRKQLLEQFRQLTSLIDEHPMLQASLIILLSLLAAKLADLIITRVILRLTRKTATEIDDIIVGLLHRPIFNTVLLLGLSIAWSVGQPPANIQEHGFAIIQTLIVLLWLIFAVRLTTLVLKWMSGSRTRFRMVQPVTVPLLQIGVKLFIIGGAVYFVLVFWDANLTAWLGSAGIIGIAVGFAARDTLANLFAGVSILADSPYKVGDYVNLETGDRGEITHIGIRSTRMLTRDDIEVTIPNAVIANSRILNESGGRWLKERIRIPVKVSYDSDIKQVRQLLFDACTTDDRVCKSPEPRVRFRELGEFGLLFELLCWIEEPVLRGRIKDSLNEAVLDAFRRAEIEIPYPKRDLYFRDGKGSSQN